MDRSFYEQERAGERGGESLSRYTAKVFLLMFAGLLVSFGTAYIGYATMLIPYALISFRGFHTILLIATLVVVIAMSAALPKISTGAAALFFFLYAFLDGLTFSTYFLLFDLPSLILVFAATALYFGGMAVFGYFTRIDLSRLRTLLLGGLIFLIVVNILMMFIPGLMVMDRVVCTIGVVIFLAFTAYDVQRIQHIYWSTEEGSAMRNKAAVYMALELYLDFVNLFLQLLSIFGKSSGRRRN